MSEERRVVAFGSSEAETEEWEQAVSLPPYGIGIVKDATFIAHARSDIPSLCQALREAAQRENRLRNALRDASAALWRDQTGLTGALTKIIAAVRSRSWLLEGRGAYEWDDVRYKKEAGLAMREAKNIADDALRASGARAHAGCAAIDAALRGTP